MSQKQSVTVTHQFSRPAEQVFDAWTEPETAGKFFFKTPDGIMERVEIDARVGGTFTITERRDGADAVHMGEFQEIKRPHRLVFCFSAPMYSDETARITIEITPRDYGCELSLCHHDVAVEWVEGSRKGWAGILALLDSVL